MLFCGYTPGYWLGNWIGLGSFGGLIGTLSVQTSRYDIPVSSADSEVHCLPDLSILSGAFHAVGYYDPFSDRTDLTLLHSK